MNHAALILCLLLCGCTPVAEYKPYVQDVIDPGALATDEKDCLGHAVAYSRALDFGEVANQATQGAANNAAGAAVNPLVPVLGGAGGGMSALLSQLGILNNDQRQVFLLCLTNRGNRSGAYDVMDPNL